MKIFVKGNFFILVGINSNYYISFCEDVIVSKPFNTAIAYDVLFVRTGQSFTTLPFADIVDETDTPYASQAAFETYIYDNTGIRISIGTDLGYTASATNGVVTSSTGTDATIPLADGTTAGLLKPADFTKLSTTSGTNTGDQDLSGLQPIDTDLTTISGLTPANDDILQRKAGVWINRTLAQLWVDLKDLTVALTNKTLNLTSNTLTGTKAQFDTACSDDEFAYQSDLSGLIPYTGATTDVDLGANIMVAESFKANGTGGLGHFHLRHQSSDAVAGANNTVLFADANGDIKYKNDGNYYTTLKTSLNTANRTYTFQDRNGTIADDTDLAGKQATLVSTTNIKSVNGTTLLGSGNLAVGDALVASPLTQFASTTSAQLAGVISDETGTGNLVFSVSPALTGTPTAPTQSASDNSTKLATTAYVDSAITASAGFIPKLEANEVFRGVEYRNGSTTEDTYGGVTMTNDATSVTKTIANTTFLTKKIRKGFSHTVVSTGHMMDMRVAGSMYYVGSGFRFVISFGIPDTVYASGCRQFHGMQSSTSAPVYSDTVLVDTMTNIIGVGSESSDTNLQIFHNDASGTATKVDLGASFPANRDAGGELTTMY
jgi:hypothetical protein